MKNIRLSVSIMAHPSRKALVDKLRKQIDVHNIAIVWDRKNSVWDTGKRALLSSSVGSTHHLILQDDITIPKNLTAACRKLLQHVPDDSPVSLYMGKSRTKPYRYSMSTIVNTARRKRASFAVFDGPWWGPGIIIPTNLAEDIVAYGDEHTEIIQYDHKISQFFTDKGIKCYYTMPSLVEHGKNRSKSLLNHGTGRNASWFIGVSKSAALFPWSGRIITPMDLPEESKKNFPPSPAHGVQQIIPASLSINPLFVSPEPELSRIPELIHQIWIGPANIPWRWINTWKKCNKTWEHKLWRETDLDQINWSTENYDLYQRYMAEGCYNGAANVLRVEILNQFGGVYIDADMVCLNSLTNADFMDAQFWVSESSNQRKRPANGAMGTIAGGSVISMYREMLKEVKILHPSWKKTGALLLVKAMNQVGVRGRDLLLPSESWYGKTLKGQPHRLNWNGPIYADHFAYSTRRNSALRRVKSRKLAGQQ